MLIVSITLGIEIFLLSICSKNSVLKQISLIFSFLVLLEVILVYALKLNLASYMKVICCGVDISFLGYWTTFADVFSIYFVFLTAIIGILCLLYLYNYYTHNFKSLILSLIFLQILLVNVFTTSNLLMFYLFFESVLIPMAFIIGNWGSRQRRTHAYYLFFIYTIVGSLLFLVALLIIYSHCQTFEYFSLLTMSWSVLRQKFLWICLFLGFAVKIPMFPFHVWLPEAHSEAPTVGSVILAAILLKLGSYGMLRFLIPLFGNATQFFKTGVMILCILGMFYISLTAIIQNDLKKIIAYSSIAHMSYVVMGLVTLEPVGIIGSVFLMLGHGFVSAALFFSVGFLYERLHTRTLKFFGGLAIPMPMLNFWFLFFTLANISFPGTSNFVGELLILFAVCDENFLSAFLSTAVIIGGSVYGFWLVNRIFYGPLYKNNLQIIDLNFKDNLILICLACLIMLTGIFPQVLLNDMILVF